MISVPLSLSAAGLRWSGATHKVGFWPPIATFYMGKRIDITGQRFGRLVVVGMARKVKYKKLWKTICNCGNKRIVSQENLRSGHTKSCGCYRKEFRVSHGLSKAPIYSIWRSMKQRCCNEKNQVYKHYGGRGIKICKRWLKFENFHADMNSSYKKGLWIERIDNDKGYCPENCCWETKPNQARNRRGCVKFKGENAVDASKRQIGRAHV